MWLKFKLNKKIKNWLIVHFIIIVWLKGISFLVFSLFWIGLKYRFGWYNFLRVAHQASCKLHCHWLRDFYYFCRTMSSCCINTLRPRQNRRYFADDIFKCIFLNENVWISINISLKFVPKGLINHIPALVQIMAWRRPGNKPLSEPMMVGLTKHICVTGPQWVKA